MLQTDGYTWHLQHFSHKYVGYYFLKGWTGVKIKKTRQYYRRNYYRYSFRFMLVGYGLYALKYEYDQRHL